MNIMILRLRKKLRLANGIEKDSVKKKFGIFYTPFSMPSGCFKNFPSPQETSKQKEFFSMIKAI